MLSACSRLQPSPNLRSITLSLTGSRSSACIEAIVCSTGWFVNFVCIVFLRLTSFEKQAEQSRKGKTRFDLQPPGYYDQNGFSWAYVESRVTSSAVCRQILLWEILRPARASMMTMPAVSTPPEGHGLEP